MRRLSLLLLLCLSLPLSAHADETTKREKIREMFTLLHLDSLTQQITDSVMKQADENARQLFGSNTPAEAQAKVTRFQEQIKQLMLSQVGWKAMEPTYIDMYAQAYSEDEIDAILAFYKSPAGTTMLAKTPELTTKGMQIVQQRMQSVQPQMKQMFLDFMKDIAASAPKSSSTQTKPHQP